MKQMNLLVKFKTNLLWEYSPKSDTTGTKIIWSCYTWGCWWSQAPVSVSAGLLMQEMTSTCQKRSLIHNAFWFKVIF